MVGIVAFGLAISGLNWNPPSLSEGAGVLLLLLAPNGSGSLNLKLFRVLEVVLVPELAMSSFVGDENLYALLFALLLTTATVFGLSLLSTAGAVEIGNWMSNLGTDFNPASCTSGRLTCGTGALLLRSTRDSSRIRCSLLRILLVCFTLLLVSSDSALGSLYWVGSFRTVLPLDSVAIRRADSVFVWRRFIWSSCDMVGICSSVLGGLLIEEVELPMPPVALSGRLYGVRGLDIRMLRFMLRSSSLKRFRAWTSPGTFEDASVLFRLKLLPNFRASVNGPER